MRWFGKVNHVPYAQGPYIPGCCDIMTDYSKCGLFLRVYYPTNCKGKIEDYKNKWIPWVPDESYLVGFGRVLTLWLFVVRLVIWIMSGKLYIPVVYGAKIKTNEKLKCIILSHGLGGHRFLYASTCIELASQGFVIFALEHRDESSCRTYYYKNKEHVEKNYKTFIEHAFVKLGNDHYTIRNNQVMRRSEECLKMFELINNIQKGIIPQNILENLPTEKNTEFNLNQLVGILDVENVTMMGHSFGAATALVTISKEKRLKQAILLDPWMFPIKNMPELIDQVKQHILFVNTQTFHIASNIKVMQNFVEANKEIRPMYTIKHTTHESQTDSVFVVGYWLNWFMKKMKPEKAIRINCSLILRYLKDQTGEPEDISQVERYLLKENDNVYSGLTKPWA